MSLIQDPLPLPFAPDLASLGILYIYTRRYIRSLCQEDQKLKKKKNIKTHTYSISYKQYFIKLFADSLSFENQNILH